MGFFLLADNLRDAVTCAVRNLKDVQLALVVCRLYEGINSPTFYEVLRDDVLPLAREAKNQVTACAHDLLLQRPLTVLRSSFVL